jgi:hypothetical protein
MGTSFVSTLFAGFCAQFWSDGQITDESRAFECKLASESKQKLVSALEDSVWTLVAFIFGRILRFVFPLVMQNNRSFMVAYVYISE